MSYKTLCVVGLGYIGLPTAQHLCHARFARGRGRHQSGNRAKNSTRARCICSSPGLRTLVQAAVQSGNLVVRSQPEPRRRIPSSPFPPPLQRWTNGPTWISSTAAAEAIVPHLKSGNLVIFGIDLPAPHYRGRGCAHPGEKRFEKPARISIWLIHPSACCPGRSCAS